MELSTGVLTCLVGGLLYALTKLVNENARLREVSHLLEEQLWKSTDGKAAVVLHLRGELVGLQMQLAERRHTIEQAYSLATLWLARPEPPTTGELIELATLLEGKQQPADGREDAQ